MESTPSEPTAVIGTACRFPGASSPARLWDLLKSPKDLLKDIPPSRFNANGFYRRNGNHHGATNVKASYLLDENHRAFDTSFFNISPREAEAMDPQQRFLLEVVYEAIESAGYPLNSLAGSDTSVFVGVMSGDYHDLQLRDVNSLPQHMATGTARSILSNRVSYFFDWKGPSMTIDTACSSSLVAVHQAIATLRQGSQIAIVAGANLILGPEAYIFESKLRMLSPTGRSRMWDASADGYARGEGFAAIMLKPLSKAIQDGDTIDCVIRSSGVNQDGYGPTGLTAPIAAAQVALIRKTYADAGLDPNQTSDRCQYFEAHGTGTAAGDPVEAEAISRAFFSSTEKRSTEQRMYVGSIKTVIGHLEGTAGLAGLLKASLMVQNGLIPPNMLFKTLNPAITPFYTNLEVPTVATPWPNLPENAPRRVSVNSFGFGGTNAHVIVENYPAQLVKKRSETLQDTLKSSDPVAPILPVILSAKTGSALARTLRSVHAYLEAHPKTSCIDLAWTSIFHRTLFAYRHSFSVVTTEALKDCLLSTAAELETSETRIRSISSAANVQPRILGVLTGQGAQWPTMGSSLLRHCPTFAESIRHMDSALAELPDKPAWTLKDAMQVEETTSQIHSAQVSQPVCTAVQIALIDLLKSIGIIFSAVIGHSSGEIAAAYAAGVITAKEAIYIAYYRGRYSYLATGFDDANGAMMATGLSFAQATVFCAQDQWAGRLVVAADNGPSSTTMSGDRDAILEADDALRNEGVFTRMLKVDKAYHSHHMYPCAKPYLGSLERCHIHPQLPNCTWISTVHVHQVLDEEDIAAMHGPYWVQNMENPVLFTQSLELVLRTQAPFDVAVEIGPHPSLAGPSKQTMKATLSDPIPYHGTLNRNESDIVAISSTLGFLMTHLASPNVDFRHYQHLFPSVSAPRFLKDFPTYCWDHGREFWKESRTSERFRSRYTGIHDLLGSRLPDDDEDVMRWSNVLHAQELPWASGHCFQNQILFPAAGYILMAVEASTLMVAGRHIQALTLLDLQILKAITLDESSTGIATIFTITKGGPQDLHADCLRADFTLYAATQQGSVEMIKHFSGSVLVYLAHSGPPGFSQREKVPDYMIDVGVRQFYESMSSVGLDYTGAFQGIISMRRSNLRSTTEVSHEEYFSNESALLIHPALVDSCLQGLLAAFAAPGDGSLWTAYLPTSVHRAHFNLDCFTPTNRSTSFVDSYVTESSASSLVGDVEVFNAQGCLQLQLEGLTCTAIEKPSPLTDRKLFARTAWKCEPFNSMESNALPPQKVTWVQQLAEVCERYSYLYLKNLRLQIHKEEEESLKWHLKRLFAFVDHILPLLEEGRCLTYDPEWTNDTEEILDTLSNPMRDEVDIQIVRAIGSSLVDICRGKKEPLEILQQNDMLSRQYINGLGFSACNEHVSAIANQIVHRYPNMRILEIGAGTGATTRAMAKAMGSHYHEYYYTDVSAGFFERAKTILNSDKVTYTILNIEDDPTTQGFEQNSFDLIVASNVLHATRYLKKTMRYVRKLLKPGGFLLLMEITGGWLRNRLPVSCLPGWWLGADDDRPHGATRTEEQWEELLLDAGFSGLDRVERDAVAGMPHSMSTILSQATDDLVQTIRRPLDFPEMIEPPSRLIILGGKSLRVSSIAQDIKLHLKNWHPNIDIIKSPDEIEVVECRGSLALLSIADFDDPLFYRPTQGRLTRMKALLKSAGHVLWALQDSHSANPAANMSLGIARTVRNEMPGLSIQTVNIESDSPEIICSNTARYLAESMLRLILFDSPRFDEGTLCSKEPELMIKNGKVWIPRIVPAQSLNDRLNAARRNVTRTVDLDQDRITFNKAKDTDAWSTYCQGQIADLRVPHDHVLVRVQASLLHPIRIEGDTFLFPCIGYSPKGERIFALSHTNDSVAIVPSQLIVPCFIPNEDTSFCLWTFACGLISRTILNSCPRSGCSLVYEPDEVLQTVLRHCARNKDTPIRFVDSNPGLPVNDDSININPFTSRRQVQSSIPHTVSAIFNAREPTELFDLISEFVAPAVRHDSSWIHGNESHLCPRYSLRAIQTVLVAVSSLLRDILATDFSKTNRSFNKLSTGISAFSMEEVQTKLALASNLIEAVHATTDGIVNTSLRTMVSYENNMEVKVRVEPVDSVTGFSPHKTYFLVGLTGDMGQSLARWMVNKGAKHVVLTSRSPNVSHDWLTGMEKSGANVRIFAMDVANTKSVQGVVTTIRETMPPIGGVCNAAMVLSDQTFADTDADEFETVTRPKVDGSECLDQIFYSDRSLDFFILFSSLASVIGNSGQGNYNAANMYMASLARRRKSRGLSASIIDIGMVVGLGYLSRNPRFVAYFERMNFMPLSESDLHKLFVEAITVGKPGVEEDMELIVGLSGVLRMPHSNTSSERSKDPPKWFKDPRFSHLLEDDRKDVRPVLSSNATASVTQQLSKAKDRSSIQMIVETAIAAQLALQLQMSADNIHPQSPLTSLGIDSLIAVDLRMWLLTTLDADVPLFKMLNGITIGEIGTHITQQLCTALLGNSSSEADTASQPPPKQSPASDGPVSSLDLLRDSTLISSNTEESEQELNTDDHTSPEFPPTQDVKPVAILREAPLSAGQASLLFMQTYTNDKCISNVSIRFRLQGKLDSAKFEDAILAVIHNHEILRTAFLWRPETNDYVQVVLRHSPFRFHRRFGDTDLEHENARLLTIPFDLGKGHTMEATLISQSAAVHYVIFCYHHIVMDGISWQIFTHELNRAYSGESISAPLGHQIDFVRRESDKLVESRWAAALDYWSQEFADPPETLPLLPISKVPCRQHLDVYSTSTVSLRLCAATAAQIRRMSRNLNITPFQFFLSTLQVLLYRFTGVTDQCIGIIDANRSERTFANTVGYLINTLPLRFFLNDTSRFHDVVKQTQTKMHGAMANADVPFSKIIEKLKIPRTSSHAPLFQILVNYRLGALEQTRIGDCDLSDMEGQVPKTPFDLTALIVEKAKGECLLQFDVQNYLYSKEDSLQLLRSYAHILEVMSQTSDTPISDCEIFSPAMRKESLRFSQGAISLQSDRSTTIWSLIDAQTRLAPQDIAMKDSYGTNMSYRSVQSKVNAIISKFRSENIKPLSTIALLCEPSADAICGLLAIWAYGATCVPLDLCNPIPRLNAMIQECSPTSLLFHSKSRDSLAGIRLGDASSIDVGLEGAEDEEYEGSRSEFDCSIDPQSLALILYTSGSTGRPKGVGLTHLNLLNCISGMEQTLNLGKEVVLQQSSLGFDLAVAQIAVALTRSGTLVIASRAQRGDAIELSRLMRSEGVSFTFCVPSEYAILLRFGHRDLAHCRNWRLAISAGERLTAQLKREFCKLKSEVELVNAYGPTETTIISHLTKICYKPKQGMHEQETSTSEELLHVGRPLPNVLTYIVDEAGQLMPIGFPGEVYIGGLGVSPGYYRDQELTQGSFLPDVFIPNGENALEWHVHRLYRSGDRGRLLANGSLVPLGRVDGDQQIKLRGMRVDLESIESSIVSTSHGIVQEAIVVQRGEPAFLAGFVVFGDVKISSNSRLICQRILTELPEAVYMRPAVLIPLETLPRNANGKTDRVALQSAVIERDFGHSEVIADSAFTAFETTLMKLWRQLLFYDDITPLRISRSTDFFAAGGSSLLLVELQNLIHGEFQVLVPLKDLFISSSIEKMSIRIRDGVKSSISSHRIDWDTETAIPQAILDLSASIEQKPRIKAKRQGLRVGLTGAFGYLGGVILDELVAEPAIAKIDCLAIRPRPVGHIHNCSFSQVQSNKIKIHGGDLSKPLLGLSDSIFHELSDTLDAIVHNGADVSFLKDYAGLRAANVDSTKELIRMSMSRKIPIHYVSTTGIAQLLPQEAGEKSRILTPLPSSQLPHPRANVSAYIASKYVSERLLERACSQLCIPVCVYRPSNIVRTCPPGDVEVGRMEKDLLGALLSYSRAIGKVPILNRWSGDVDFVSLGNVAKTVVSKCLASIHDQPCFTTGAMRIVHLCGEHTAPINELSSLIQDREVGLDKIELDVWLCLAKAKGLSDAMGATIQHLSCEHLNLARIKEGEQVW